MTLSNVSGKIDLTLTPAQLAPYAQPGLTTRLPTLDVTALQVYSELCAENDECCFESIKLVVS